MESKKTELENLISSGNIKAHKELEKKSNELNELEQKIEEATIRWMELSEKYN